MILSNLLTSIAAQFNSVIFPQSIQYVIFLSPLLLVMALISIFTQTWIRYVRLKQFLELKYTVLEIKLPRDTWKSPLAMESVLHAIHNTSDGGLYAQFWKGETRPWYSLEIISIEGAVKFMIWTEDRRKAGLMGALYSQFPGVEVYEREDYARSVHFDPKTMKMWAAEFEFTKKDPYPIRTYVDYGLDKDPKEEFKVDPLVPIIEWLGSLGPNEQVWFQFVVRAHKNDQRKPGHLWMKTDLWRDDAEKLMNEIMKRDPVTKVAGVGDPETGFARIPTLHEAERDVLKSLARSITKLAFDVGIRGVYIAKRDIFNTPFGIGGIIGGLKQFNSENLNGFKPNGKKWHVQFDHPWQDYKEIRKNRLSKRFLQAYRRRSYFYEPFKSKSLVMNTEELATIYHFPGPTAASPGLERIQSKKSQAPGNLPV